MADDAGEGLCLELQTGRRGGGLLCECAKGMRIRRCNRWGHACSRVEGVQPSASRARACVAWVRAACAGVYTIESLDIVELLCVHPVSEEGGGEGEGDE